MPGFILDVHGLGTTFKTLDGVIDAVNGVSFGLAEDETLSVVGESDNPGLAARAHDWCERHAYHVPPYPSQWLKVVADGNIFC